MFGTPTYLQREQFQGASGVYWAQRGELYFFYPYSALYGGGAYKQKSGGLMISYPDMACFPLKFPYGSWGEEKSFDYWDISIECCGLIPPVTYNSVNAPWMRYLGLSTINKKAKATGYPPTTTAYIGMANSACSESSIEGYPDGGNGFGDYSTIYNCIYHQEIFPGGGAIVSPLEVEMHIGCRSYFMPTSTEPIAARLDGHLYGTQTNDFIGNSMDVRTAAGTGKYWGIPTNRAYHGFTLTVMSGGIYSAPGLDNNWCHLQYFGSRIPCYTSTPGRR